MCMLLDDTLRITIHKIRKAILCLTRDWCNECGIHESRCVLYVSNLVDDVGLVEIMCATCATVTSRRDYFSSFTKRRIKVTTEGSNNDNER